ncbi:hypothetical protein GLOTRDRAFT_93693 [Gloeophyllum trabeum ATCC 11539]|uniref:Uncharacterized protein n=1 Tax=Gloeophyllum trabeum (strain ATCC 11539 / FP-39264 / Madison 617) TaxID=670483 RepID=S7Q6M1_GLOTA|nr:uncharacterized protein GLOTRDRAFT_93693 [Gloeophyllum trabeum ATCC 11539]EPQ55167.1 hypothetical protein GLOTRDRAFT_93693 [Gloeophyllum trabeum ATCC 11539]
MDRSELKKEPSWPTPLAATYTMLGACDRATFDTSQRTMVLSLNHLAAVNDFSGDSIESAPSHAVIPGTQLDIPKFAQVANSLYSFHILLHLITEGTSIKREAVIVGDVFVALGATAGHTYPDPKQWTALPVLALELGDSAPSIRRDRMSPHGIAKTGNAPEPRGQLQWPTVDAKEDLRGTKCRRIMDAERTVHMLGLTAPIRDRGSSPQPGVNLRGNQLQLPA